MPGRSFPQPETYVPPPNPLDEFIGRLMQVPGLHPQQLSKVTQVESQFTKVRGTPRHAEQLAQLEVAIGNLFQRMGSNPAVPELVDAWMVCSKALQAQDTYRWPA